MFTPGETVVHHFIIPFADDELAKVVITYKQHDRIVFMKEIISNFEKITEVSTRITLALSQQETLLFDDNSNYSIMLNVFTNRGSRATSAELHDRTGKQHYKKVMSNG